MNIAWQFFKSVVHTCIIAIDADYQAKPLIINCITKSTIVQSLISSSFNNKSHLTATAEITAQNQSRLLMRLHEKYKYWLARNRAEVLSQRIGEIIFVRLIKLINTWMKGITILISTEVSSIPDRDRERNPEKQHHQFVQARRCRLTFCHGVLRARNYRKQQTTPAITWYISHSNERILIVQIKLIQHINCKYLRQTSIVSVR